MNLKQLSEVLINIINQLVPYGAGNIALCDPNLLDAEFRSIAIEKTYLCESNSLNTHEYNPFFKKIYLTQSGNCKHLNELAMQLLNCMDAGTNRYYYAIVNPKNYAFDHCFIAIAEKNNPADIFIIDPWAKTSYPLSAYQENLLKIMQAYPGYFMKSKKGIQKNFFKDQDFSLNDWLQVLIKPVTPKLKIDPKTKSEIFLVTLNKQGLVFYWDFDPFENIMCLSHDISFMNAILDTNDKNITKRKLASKDHFLKTLEKDIVLIESLKAQNLDYTITVNIDNHTHQASVKTILFNSDFSTFHRLQQEGIAAFIKEEANENLTPTGAPLRLFDQAKNGGNKGITAEQVVESQPDNCQIL